MRSFREIPAVRRLNAPTRAAAARRRRLRKGSSAALVALATLIVVSPSSGRTTDAEPPATTSQLDLRGRHLMSLPVDATLINSLPTGGRVDVWDSRGLALAHAAPARKPKDNSAGLSASGANAHLLVALTSDEVRRISKSESNTPSDAPKVTITISPT